MVTTTPIKYIVVKFLRALFAATLLVIGVASPAASADQSTPLHLFGVCQTTSSTDCIESITATMPNGEKIAAVHVMDAYSDLTPVWQLPGAKFQDGGDKFIGRLALLKDGEALCWYQTNNCSYHAGYVDLWFYPYDVRNTKAIHFSHDATDLQCGTVSNPVTCTDWVNFGLNIRWDTIFRIKNFRAGMLSGSSRGAQIMDLSPTLPVAESHRFEVIGTNFMRDGNVISEVRNSEPSNRMYADGQVDNFSNWIWDSNNDAVLYRFPPRCMPNILSGPIVHFMFNSYGIGNPEWDQSTKTLSVNVGSPHFSANGSPALGYYEMYFPNAVAKCLWGLSDNGVVKANVMITDSDGTPNIATISQNQDQDGLTVIASNFHFSSPTIKVKLSQESSNAIPIPSPSPTPSATVTPLITPSAEQAIPIVKKLTITCIKGKVLKSVTGVKPVCPAGYKKK